MEPDTLIISKTWWMGRLKVVRRQAVRSLEGYQAYVTRLQLTLDSVKSLLDAPCQPCPSVIARRRPSLCRTSPDNGV